MSTIFNFPLFTSKIIFTCVCRFHIDQSDVSSIFWYNA